MIGVVAFLSYTLTVVLVAGTTLPSATPKKRAAPEKGAVYQVDSTLDEHDLTPGDGVCESKSGVCTLRAAIQEADVQPGADTVMLPAGYYPMTEYAVRPEDDITILGAGAADTIIDFALSEEFGGGFLLVLPITTTFKDLTVQNSNGGAFYMADGESTLDSCAMRNNSGHLGGPGVAVLGGDMTVVNSAIVENVSGAYGGGVLVWAGTVWIGYSRICDNRADRGGGGVHVTDGDVTIVGTTICRNLTGLDGTGFGAGGGVLSTTGNTTIFNSTLSGNVATELSGGGVQGDANTTIGSSTISENHAPRAGGVGGNPAMVNTIVYDNTADITGPNCWSDSGPIDSSGYNIFGDLTGCSIAVGPQDATGNPGLGPFTDYGPPNHGHYPLLNVSGAIDYGTTAQCLALDQLGLRRPPALPPVNFGFAGVKPVPADYDGDGEADRAVYDSATSKWFIKSTYSPTVEHTFGFAGIEPVPGDYDGDGSADLAFFDPATSTWYIRPSGGGGDLVIPFGFPGVLLAPADYDGDGKTDLAVFDPVMAKFFIRPSAGGGDQQHSFGFAGLKMVPGDYDGDGEADLAGFFPTNNTWYYRPSTGGGDQTEVFGFAGVKLVQADYDGDGKTDPGVYDPVTSTWYYRPSTGGGDVAVPFGGANNTPLPGHWDGDSFADRVVYNPTTHLWSYRVSDRCDTGSIEFFCTDFDDDTFLNCVDDCNDADDGVYPGAADECDGIAADCDDPAWPTPPDDEADLDGDGYVACEPWLGADPAAKGATILGGGDCDDDYSSTFPGAPEINDALDNQCAGDLGYGVTDEVSGSTGFGESGGTDTFSWQPQGGATGYEVARSTTPDFATDCVITPTASAEWTDPGSPGSDVVFYYLSRAVAPNVGSWGQDSEGVPRPVDCD